MNLRTIGSVELNSIAVGIHVADEMVKCASVDLLIARPTCPGRYLIIVSGDTGSVKTAVETGRDIGKDMVIDWFTIPSVHPSVIPALSGTSLIPEITALGVIETFTTVACILAADAAAKSGAVDIIEIRSASGLGGKAFVTMTGDVGSVEASVAAGIEGVGDSGPVASHVVIPSPSQELKQKLL
ncbi:MAG: BMC domain-containing protein [Desulfobacterium sp.]|nr:BMC domain-containing protein [Desulfobacterium sp.]